MRRTKAQDNLGNFQGDDSPQTVEGSGNLFVDLEADLVAQYGLLKHLEEGQKQENRGQDSLPLGQDKARIRGVMPERSEVPYPEGG